MTWTSFECRKLRKLKYNDQDQSLEIVYRDGDHARALGISQSRYEQLISASAEDRDTFFTNIIEPFVVSRKPARRAPKAAMQRLAIALLLAGSSWLFLWGVDHIVFVMKQRY